MAIKGLDSPVFEGQAMVRARATRHRCGLPTACRPWRVAALPRELVGQSQPEVSETLSGRQVQSYEVLVRIAEGLGVSRGAMGLAYAGDDEGPMLFDDVTEDMRRRAVLAAATTALFGALILGEVLELPERPNTPTPLPAEPCPS